MSVYVFTTLLLLRKEFYKIVRCLRFVRAYKIFSFWFRCAKNQFGTATSTFGVDYLLKYQRKLAIQDSKDQKSEFRIQKSEIRNQKSEIITPVRPTIRRN